MVMKRDDLLKHTTEVVNAAIEHRNMRSIEFAHKEETPNDIAVCLGTARCMYPQRNRDFYCPFCLVITPKTTAADANETARRFVKGN
jgi:hypothetical protein